MKSNVLLLPIALITCIINFSSNAQDNSKQQEGDYWISYANNITHNKSCRCYGRCDGYHSTKGSGKNCQVCGGTNE